MEKKKAGGQNKGIVEEEAPLDWMPSCGSATVKSQLKMVMMGTIGISCRSLASSGSKLDKEPEAKRLRRADEEEKSEATPTEVVTHSESQKSDQAVAPYGWQLVSLGW